MLREAGVEIGDEDDLRYYARFAIDVNVEMHIG